jgi:hypothetical protein
MTLLPRALMWTRTDTPGAEHVVFDDRHGLVAHGVQIAVDPVPYTCRYELYTDESWATARFTATAEGAGWMRTVRMERAAGRWRVTTAEQGQFAGALKPAASSAAHAPGIEDPDRLEDVLDVDLGGSPLTNTLPLKRLRLTGTATVATAWVLPPSLAVVREEQTYTRLSENRVRYASDSFEADIELDERGYVRDYPGLATRGA